ncbi:g3349 [Coccomyxa elongata]
MEEEGGSRSGSLLQRLLAGACMSPAGVVLEAGNSGSLHMTLSDDLIRAALRQPLPVSSQAQPLLEPLWESESEEGSAGENDESSSEEDGDASRSKAGPEVDGQQLGHGLKHVVTRGSGKPAQPWWRRQARPMKRALAATLGALPAIALCASVLALGLIAGFLLAAPLTPQVMDPAYQLGPDLLAAQKLPSAPVSGMAFGGEGGPDPSKFDIMVGDDFGVWQNKTMESSNDVPVEQSGIPGLETVGGPRRTPRVPIKGPDGNLLPLPRSLRVCTMSADFWGLPTAGGTATAYGLLTSALSEDPSLDVTLLGVSKMMDKCIKGRKQQSKLNPRANYACFDDRHFEPFVVTTQPYEGLSHATLEWLKENQHLCDVLQVHEWGGVFTDIVTYSHFRQFRPGLRIAINSHGGHYWSTQGQLPRPTDIMSLRIDNGERATLEYADIALSPTRYIASWLRQRGWRLPDYRLPVPNMIADLDQAPKERVEKPVWRVAFFGRLEERKGIKLFVDAVQRLPKEILEKPEFESYFVGAESKIDQVLSSTWLKAHTRHWTWKNFIMANTPRDKALATISADGILLVLASMIDNMPYVLAEASVMRIPLLIYDVGGVTEMIDPKLHADIICGTPKGDELAPRMRDALLRGKLGISALSPRVTTGKEQWQEWHHDFFHNQREDYIQDDIELHAKADIMNTDLEVITLREEKQTALELYEEVCDAEGCTERGCSAVTNATSAPPTILLLPPQFSVLNESRLPELVRLLNIGELRKDSIGALTFGAEIPPYKDGALPTAPKLRYAFPTAPTWQVYEGEVEPWLMSDYCTDTVPVLLRRSTFCRAFAADAKDFRAYNSWVLSLMLGQAGLHLHTFPEVAFRLDKWTMQGYPCVLDKTPNRQLDIHVAANLMTDEMLMRTAQLTPEYRPLVDFHSQYSTTQSQKGWRYGYTDASRPMETNTTFHEMVWHAHKNGHIADGRWQATETQIYPQLYRYILHPCVSWPGMPNMCGGLQTATGTLRFDSFLTQENVVIMLIYEVFPKCGDGVNFVVTLTPVDGGPVQTLHEAEYEVAEKPTRQRLHFYLDKLSTGDKVDLLVYPRAQHDCDGALILEVQIWEQKAYKG